MTAVDYLVNDFDNHYYEAIDAFTRHLDPKLGRRIIQWAEIDGRKYHVIGGRVSHAVVNPTFDPIAKAGAMSEYFRGNASGRPPLEYLASVSPSGPSTATATPVCVMDEQGVDKIWLFPTLGMIYEQLLKHDPEGVGIMFRAFNRWLEEDWGYEYQDRIFASPYIALCDIDVAVEELERALAMGARTVCMRPAAPTTVFGPLTPGDPYFDPFWARANEAGITVVVHAGDSGYSTNGYSREGFSADFAGGGKASIGMLSMERAIYDFLASLVFDRLFERFPNLRIASVENGAEFLPDLFRKLRSVNRKIPGLFKEDPIESFKRHVWINPFWEDDVYEIVDHMGADRVVFGSDWPHIEGLPSPIDYTVEVKELDPASQRLILRDNAETQPAPPCLAREALEHPAHGVGAHLTDRRGGRLADLGGVGSDGLDGRVAVQETAGHFEADTRVVAAADAEAFTGRVARLVREPPDQRRNQTRVKPFVERLARRERAEAGAGSGLGVGRDHVGGDADRPAFRRHREGEADHAHLRHPVDRAAGYASEGRPRRHVDETSAVGRGHHLPRRAAHVERAA